MSKTESRKGKTRISKVKWTAGVKNEDPNVVSIYADDTAIFTESNNTQIKSQNSCSHRENYRHPFKRRGHLETKKKNALTC